MFEEMIKLLSESGGFSRTNNFRVEMTLPEKISRYNQKIDVLNMSCSAAELPGVALDTVKSQNGPAIQPDMVHTIKYQDVDLNFYVSKNFLIRHMLEEWRKLAIDDTTQGLGYYDDYVGQLNIFPMKRGSQQDRDGNSLIMCTLVNAFPKQVGSIRYAYDEEGQVAILPVTFSYKKYELL